jgi:hypothetical protein
VPAGSSLTGALPPQYDVSPSPPLPQDAIWLHPELASAKPMIAAIASFVFIDPLPI